MYANDTTGPVIDTFSFTPETVDVTSSDQVISFEAHATDETGVSGFQACIYNPDNFGKTCKYGVFELVSGDKKDGTYKATITIEKDQIPGRWIVSVVNIRDELGNDGSMSCSTGGGLIVVNNSGTDTTGPVIDTFSFTPETVDVTSSDQVISFEAHATDETGVSGFQACIYNPDNFGKTCKYGVFELVSGDKKDGTYKATITIEKDQIPGRWIVSVVNIRDELGNDGSMSCSTGGDLTVVNNSGTGINNCYINNRNDNQIYSINGIKTSKVHSGIVIVNGRKIVKLEK